MTNNRNEGSGQLLYKRAKQLIPGGTQLLSKRPEMFLPEQWPSYYSKASGALVWDLDGNEYLDMAYNGIGACVLGYADPEVNAAVHAAVDAGSAATLNCPEEVELAELLCQLHPWADMVRYARSGGESMAIAVRIARASTGRDKVAFCGYHGWHDWYLAANLASDHALDGHLLSGLNPAGVPRSLEGTALPFHYNRIEELKEIVQSSPREIAAIVMEPVRSTLPEPGFLEEVRRIADETGAVLIFDEITVGFRLASGGAHLIFGVEPDMAVFAKAISNGYPMAAIIGRAQVMEAAQSSFISSTSWTDRIGPAAALATIKKHIREGVPEKLAVTGARVQKGWAEAASDPELRVAVSGTPPLPHLEFEYPESRALGTLFTQLMLDRGILATRGFYPTYAHEPHHVDKYLTAVEEVFSLLATAIGSGEISDLLNGPVAHSGFQRLT
jgi:glutamate-1-semialdehyde 2,1-aminomutase